MTLLLCLAAAAMAQAQHRWSLCIFRSDAFLPAVPASRAAASSLEKLVFSASVL